MKIKISNFLLEQEQTDPERFEMTELIEVLTKDGSHKTKEIFHGHSMSLQKCINKMAHINLIKDDGEYSFKHYLLELQKQTSEITETINKIYK